VKWFAVIAVMLAFAPCASARATGSSCDLLTGADAAKVMGVKVAYRSVRGNICTWTSVPHGPFQERSILVLSSQRISATKFHTLETQTKAQARTFSRLRNLGDDAFTFTLASGSAPTPQLWVLSHGFLLEVSTFLGTAEVDAETAAARLALKRL
jgi:hypothetical protein